MQILIALLSRITLIKAVGRKLAPVSYNPAASLFQTADIFFDRLLLYYYTPHVCVPYFRGKVMCVAIRKYYREYVAHESIVHCIENMLINLMHVGAAGGIMTRHGVNALRLESHLNQLGRCQQHGTPLGVW